MPKRSELSILRSVPLFEGMSDRNLRVVLREAKEDVFSPGQTIVKEGQAGGRFYVIIEGRAAVLTGSRKRATLGSGAFFGEISLLDRGTRSATVTAETHIRALSIASWNFLSLLEENWGMARKVLVQLCARIRNLERSLTH